MENSEDQLEALMARVEAAEQRIAELEGRTSARGHSRGSAGPPEGREEVGEGEADRQSRRSLLKMAGGAAAGVAAISVLGATRAGAADDDNVIIGEVNSAELSTTLNFDGAADGLVVDSTVLPLLDVDASAPTAGSGGDGLHGTGDAGQTGIFGLGFGGGAGIAGASDDGIGVAGDTEFLSGTDYGADVMALGNGNLVQVPLPDAGLTTPAGPPNYTSVGAPSFFELVRDENGGLWSSDVTGAFHPVLSAVPLPAPVRVISTASPVVGGITGPLVPGSTQHTSVDLRGSNGIPSNAVGVVGNFAISGVNGALLNGFGVASIFPAGVTTPATANINSGSGCFAISNAVTVAFGTGANAGMVAIVWSGGGAVPNAEAFLDVIGYIL